MSAQAEQRDPQLWARAKSAARGFRRADIHDGSWFSKLLQQHVRGHHASTQDVDWALRYPGLDLDARAERHIKGVARKAAAAGLITSLGASAGELLALVTEGLAAPIGLPAAMLSMVAAATYTTLAQLDLASDLASMYGVPFGDDADDMAVLFAVVAGAGAKKTGHEPEVPEGAVTRLTDLEFGTAAKHLGKSLLEETIRRNIVPVVGIAISARWNYVATIKFASHVQRHIRHRLALGTACAELRLADVKNPALFAHGAWLLALCDGEPTHAEKVAISRMLAHLPPSDAHVPSLDIEAEETWFKQLAGATHQTDGRLIEILSLIAATETDPVNAERRFLARVGHTLGHKVDFARIERLCTHLREGISLPDGFFATRHFDAEAT